MIRSLVCKIVTLENKYLMILNTFLLIFSSWYFNRKNVKILSHFQSATILQAFTDSLERVSSLVTKMKNVTLILSKCVDLRLLDLEQVAGLMRSMQVSENAGTRNLTIFLSTLKRLDVGRDEIATMLEESGVDLVSFLPDCKLFFFFLLLDTYCFIFCMIIQVRRCY